MPPTAPRPIDAVATVLMVGLTFTWGFNQVAAKVSTEGFSPVFLTFARSLIGLAMILLWCRLRGIRLLERDGTLLPGILAGAAFGIEFALIFLGLDYTTAVRATLMVNTMPFFVAIGAHLFLGERLTAARLAGLVLAFSGVALVLSDDLSLPSPEALKGDLMCLAGGLLWAVSTLVIKGSRLRAAPAEKTLAYQLVMAAVVAVPLMPFAGPLVREPTALATASLLFQGVFVVGITYTVWFTMMRIYPASGLTSFAFLTPVFGVISGGLLLGEPLSPKVIGALVLIATGLVLVNVTVRRGRGDAATNPPSARR
jgi:drug/metabolite transporter (DMT)-like permease